MNKKDQLYDKISEYYSGEKDPAPIKRELEADPKSGEVFRWIDSFWSQLRPPAESGSSIHDLTFKKINSRKSVFLGMMKYAALTFIVISLSWVGYTVYKKDVEYIHIVSGVGEVKELNLPDGSKVWLNAKSEITYPEKFAKNQREVSAEGEVYFEVAHDRDHPFFVNSPQFRIKVLGTRFMVNNYLNEPTADTYLAEGSIQLHMDSVLTQLVLTPGDEVHYLKGTSMYTKTKTPNLDSSLGAWRFGRISFYNETLFQIARRLERHFGNEIKIDDERLGTNRFTAEFDPSNLDQILSYLKEVAGFDYYKVNNTYLITKN